MNLSKQHNGLVAIACLTLSLPLQVQAQTGTDDDSSGRMIEEVVVTARRKTESLQDVPLSVSAMGAEKLEQAGIDTAFDIQGNTPSFTISASTVGRSTPFLMIRGQRVNDFVLTVDPAVSVYINEVPIARVQGLGVMAVLDTESLEVLKGPQGTLFGKNTTGGALVIHSKRPGQEFEAGAKFTSGNLNQRKMQGDVNVPITDWLAVRGAVVSEERDSSITDRDGGEGWYNIDDRAWRLSAMFSFEQFESTFFADGFETDNRGSTSALSWVDPDGAANLVTMGGMQAALERQQAGGYYETESNIEDSYERVETYGLSNTSTYDFDNGIRAKVVMGVREVDLQSRYDLDGSNEEVVSLTQPTEAEQESFELQFQGDLFEGCVDWTVGGLYFKEEGNDSIAATLLGLETFLSYEIENKSRSFYGAATWHILDDLRLAVGLRQTVDKRSIVLGPPAEGSGEETFKEPTWDINIGYNINEDTMAYLAHRHGYRSGGFNARAPNSDFLEPFAPEFVDDIELGLKTSFEIFGTSLQLNMAAFYSDYQDLQRGALVATSDGSLTVVVQTAANATITGGEFEWTWLPTENLDITGYVSMQKARYDEWDTPTFSTGVGAVDDAVDDAGLVGDIAGGAINSATGGMFEGTKDVSHNRFAGVPDYMANITLRYRLPFSSVDLGDIFFQASAVWQSETDQWEFNGPTTRQEAYTTVNARFEWNNMFGLPMDLAAWVKNITREEYFAGVTSFEDNLGFVVQHRAEPRTQGVSISYRF